MEMENLVKEEIEEEETHFYKEAFDSFDWNHSGRIATSVSKAEGSLYSFWCLFFSRKLSKPSMFGR